MVPDPNSRFVNQYGGEENAQNNTHDTKASNETRM